MRVRRLRKRAFELDITAFLNLIVVLVPFLLSTAVFSRLAVVELSLPAQANNKVEQLKGDLQLEIVMRPDSLDVADRIGGLIQKIPNTASGYDTTTLAAVMLALKQKFPEKTDASVLVQPTTPYDTLIRVMDAVRATKQANGAKLVKVDLFPDISIGDAPITAAQAAAAMAQTQQAAAPAAGKARP